MRSHLISGLLFSVAPACGGSPPEDVPAVPGYPYAYAQADCAPWDGAAVTVTLTAVALDSAGAAPTGRFLTLRLWKGRSELTGQAFHWPAQPEPGNVARCDRLGNCETLTRGTVWIDGMHGDTLSGALDVELAGGDQIRGGFDAQWIDRRIMCG